MSIVTLIELNPRGPADGVVQTIRLVHNARVSGRFLGQQWLPQIISLPDFELDLGFDGQKFGQGATPQVGQLVLAVSRESTWPSLAWKGALVGIRFALWPAGLADPVDGDFSAVTYYRVEDAACSADGVLSLTLIDMGQALRHPVVVRKFGSTADPLLDGAGAIDHRGKVVPTGWGKLLGVPGLLVDRVNNIWLLLGRPSSVIHNVYDGGAAFSAGVLRASLAALQANVPAPGAVDVCGNAGGLTLCRPWTAPTYPLTADITASGAIKAADIAAAIVADRSTVAFAAGTVAAFNALQAADCQIWFNDERTIATALDELICRLGGWWKMTASGQIELGRLDFTAPAITFGEHQLASISRQRIVMPTRRRSVGWGRNNRVHSEGEIATILLVEDIAGLGDLAVLDDVDWSLVTGPGKAADNATANVDRGAWAALAIGAAMAVGDEVQDQGSTWGCILAHAKSALNSPPSLPIAVNTYWRLRAARGDAGQTGASTISIFSRAVVKPATPAPSAGVPAGFETDPDNIAAGAGPIWKFTGQRAAGAANYVWGGAVRDEALSANSTGQNMALGFATTGWLSFTLQPGQSREVRGQLAVSAPTGTGTLYVQLEHREEGGGSTATNGVSETYAVGEPATATHEIVVTNGASVAKTYEVRGTGVRSNSSSGAPTASESKVSI